MFQEKITTSKMSTPSENIPKIEGKIKMYSGKEKQIFFPNRSSSKEIWKDRENGISGSKFNETVIM